MFTTTFKTSNRKKANKGRMKSVAPSKQEAGFTEECQFEGLHIQHIGNDILNYRLTSSAHMKAKPHQIIKQRRPSREKLNAINKRSIIAPNSVYFPCNFLEQQQLIPRKKQEIHKELPKLVVDNKEEKRKKANLMKVHQDPAITVQNALEILRSHQPSLYPSEILVNNNNELIWEGEIQVFPYKQAENELPNSPLYARQTLKTTVHSKKNAKSKSQTQKNAGILNTVGSPPQNSNKKANFPLNNQIMPVSHGITGTWNCPVYTAEIPGSYPFKQNAFQ